METEKDILIALIGDEKTRIYLDKLSQECFEDKLIGYVIKQMQEINKNGTQFNFIDIKKYIRKKIKDDSKYQLVEDLIMECVQSYWGMHSETIQSNIDILITNYNNNKIKMFIKQINNELENSVELDIDNLGTRLLEQINEIKSLTKKSEAEDIKEVFEKTLEFIEYKKKNRTENMYYGIRQLDYMTEGLHNAEMTCIGARPRNR